MTMSEGEGITIYQISISKSQFPNPKQISMFNSYETTDNADGTDN